MPSNLLRSSRASDNKKRQISNSSHNHDVPSPSFVLHNLRLRPFHEPRNIVPETMDLQNKQRLGAYATSHPCYYHPFGATTLFPNLIWNDQARYGNTDKLLPPRPLFVLRGGERALASAFAAISSSQVIEARGEMDAFGGWQDLHYNHTYPHYPPPVQSLLPAMASWSSLAGSGFSFSWLDAHVQKQGAAQNAVTASSSATTTPTPASNQQGGDEGINLQALQDEYLDFGYIDNTSASTPTYSAVATTPGSEISSPGPSYAPIPPAVNEDLAFLESIAQYPAALDVPSSATPAADFEHALSIYPSSNLINGLALRALLQESAHHVEQTFTDFRPPTPRLSPAAEARLARWEKDVNFHEPTPNDAVHLPNDDPYTNTNGAVSRKPRNRFQSAYTQQDGQILDPSLAPALGLNAFLVQPPVHYGTAQGYPAVPPAPYPPMGVPPSNYYGPPVPQPPYQYGYYPNNYYNYNYYLPNGSEGPGLAAAVPQFYMPGLPMYPPFQQPNASAKPLSASGRPNEPAQLADAEAASASAKRESAAAGRKGKGKAKSAKKTSRNTLPAPQDPAGNIHTQPARKNRTYTQVGDNRFHCSHCGRDDLTKAATKKHAEMCGRAVRSRTCTLCGTVIKSGRNSSLERHMETPLCQRMRASYAQQPTAHQPGPVGIPSMVGTQFTFAYDYDAAARGTRAEAGSGGLAGNANDGSPEHGVYADVAGPSSATPTFEDIPKATKEAAKGKAPKKN
ncbi:hypothetical protein PC9H_008296 [Pleurotus ostreatus]|uniref:Uncharacterized protein n=1 Tax=Pleurotus ostreatus TaxID=5322 RepID=A0A8H6ZRC7_PLEOS|nr:uncharacterized protein PC9H_008296 [Pleurotus ostreatus]KAF7425934.1 hypothetical protein PC9H_008296 [Pleurotus ostreatus]